MKETPEGNAKIAKITFGRVYPMYVKKVVGKGRTVLELHQVIKWLTGFTDAKIEKLIKSEVNFEEFFKQAKLNPNAKLITGTICGYRVEDLKNPTTQKTRYLDKLVDELAKGRPIEKILRKN
jgi:hypothetical protein